MDSEKIGHFISTERKKLNLTQAELASKLNVTSQAISKWENARGIPDIEFLQKLSEIFNVDISELLAGTPKKKKKISKIFISIITLLILLILGLIIYLITKPPTTFNFYPLGADNNLFTIKGIIAYDKNKKSIYISDVLYSGNDASKYQSIECILYEKINNQEKKIMGWGNIKENPTAKYLTELLKGIEFNIDNYNCSCESKSCNNLYLRINALNENNKIITYDIALEINDNCPN